jgi:uncharacterized membrane protein HdeD (DUF308 family)
MFVWCDCPAVWILGGVAAISLIVSGTAFASGWESEDKMEWPFWNWAPTALLLFARDVRRGWEDSKLGRWAFVIGVLSAIAALIVYVERC